MFSKLKNRLKKRKGGEFLIELLIALTIIGILGTGSFFLASPQINKAKDAKVKSDIRELRTALDAYYDDARCYPSILPSCGQTLSRNNTVYFSKIPCQPNGDSYTYEAENSTCPGWYRILTNLSNAKDSSIESAGCKMGCGRSCNYNYGAASTNVALNEGCPQERLYACGPNGVCIEYANPQASSCPRTFINDATCQNLCGDRNNRCRDERGKRN